MDNPAPQINVIRPEGKKFPIKSIFVILTTLLLAVIMAVSVWVLYQRRNQPVAPTAPSSATASTTTSFSDDFGTDGVIDPTNWGASSTGPASANITNQELVMSLPSDQANNVNLARNSNSVPASITGDFSLTVDLNGLQMASGSAWQELAYDSVVAVRRSRTDATETVEMYVRPDVTVGDYNTNKTATFTLPANTTTVKVKITRIQSVIQTFYDIGNGYVLLGTSLNAFNPGGNGLIRLFATNAAPTFPDVAATFDNFSASVNFAAVQPTPVPGSVAACTLSFTVLDTVATPTPGPSATPSPTPPPGATPTPTVTVTPTSPPGQPNACGGTCGSNANCQSGLICSQGFCREPQCVEQYDCICGGANPTPTPTTMVIASQPSPTPETLVKSGSTTGTWILGLGGALIIAVGTILLFAL